MTDTKFNIRLHYFALLREQRGLSREDIATSAATPRALYEELRHRHRFTLPADRVTVAVNEQMRPADHPLQPGDTVVFIPPVAGG